MMDIGLTLHDLNFYDGSSEILIAGMQHARQLQAAIDKVQIVLLFFYFETKYLDLFKQHSWISKLQSTKVELQEWRRKGKRLLYSMMPRHIAQMLQQGVVANSICEVNIFILKKRSFLLIFFSHIN